MLHITSLDDGLELFKALGSEIRISIIKQLLSNRGMNMNELATAVRYQIPVVEIVMNNSVLGMVRQWQTLFYGKRYSNTVLNDGVDFVKLAQAMGAEAFRITKCEEVEEVLKKAIALNKPVLIDCVIDSDDKVFPMVAPGAAIEDAFSEEDMK